MPQSDDPRHNLRLTRDLKARLRHAAIDNGRSVNAEILDRLARSFEPDPSRQLADLLAPVSHLDDEGRARLGALLAELGDLLTR